MKSFKEFKEEVDSREPHTRSCDIDLGFSESACVELAEQKALIMELVALHFDEDKSSKIEGLLCMIDSIQDQLHDYYDFDEDVVFPYKNHPSDEPDPINYPAAMQALMQHLPRRELPKLLNLETNLTRVVTRELSQGKKGNEDG
jgi:hypothetical protein